MIIVKSLVTDIYCNFYDKNEKMYQLNVSKFKVMRFGRSNPKFHYYMKELENLV